MNRVSLWTGSLEKIVKVGDERFTCGTNNVSPNNIHSWCYFIKNFLIQLFFPCRKKKIRISSKNTHTSNNLFRAVFQLFVWKPILRVTDRELKPLFPGYACCSNKLTCECVFPGAHQMEPPSSLNSWVNPFQGHPTRI